jgi:hypothetical protein
VRPASVRRVAPHLQEEAETLMSSGGEVRSILLHVVVADAEHWTTGQQVAAIHCDLPDCLSTADHAMHHLEAHLRQQGEEFIATYHQMFASDLL